MCQNIGLQWLIHILPGAPDLSLCNSVYDLVMARLSLFHSLLGQQLHTKVDTHPIKGQGISSGMNHP